MALVASHGDVGGDTGRNLGGNVADFHVRGAKCAGCMGKIERTIGALPGVLGTRFNLTTGKLSVTAALGALDGGAVIGALDALGYPAAVYNPSEARLASDREGRQLLFALGVAAFGAGNVMMFSVPVWAGLFGQELDSSTRTLMYWYAALVSMPCTLFAGQTFFRSAFNALRRGKVNMDVPISIGLLLTLGISVSEALQHGPHAYFDAAACLVFFLLIGRWLDHRLRQTAASAAGELLALQAPTARRMNLSGEEVVTPIGEIQAGDQVVVTPGDRIPLDGVVAAGASRLDNALITGETAPHLVAVADRVHAGALSLTGRLIITVTARWEDSTVSALARLMEIGAQTRSRYVVLADKAAAVYVPAIHSLAAVALIGGLALGLGWRESLIRAVTVLIVTCPCALGLAAPTVQITACGRLFRKGVLVKSGAALERLAEIDHVVFDKTGVLTRGRPVLLGGAMALLPVAAQLARGSRHPLARALAQAAGAGPVAADITETAGMGLTGVINGRPARLGRAAFVGVEGSADESELWFGLDDDIKVKFRFGDTLRDGAAETVAALRARGLTVEILSGDGALAVRQVADACGVEAWSAGLPPMEKVAALETRRTQGRRILMVGDGLNDAAALASAHASMAPGAAVEASQNAADLVFCGEGLDAIVLALDVAEAAQRRTRENFGFSAVYNLVAAPAAMLGLVNPLVAALAMSGSSLIVTLNALRMSWAGRRS